MLVTGQVGRVTLDVVWSRISLKGKGREGKGREGEGEGEGEGEFGTVYFFSLESNGNILGNKNEY